MSIGIKCFQDERELGDSFYQLFPVVKTRDSCQPERAAEHSCSNRDLHDDTTSSTGQETDQAERDTGKSTKMFFLLRQVFFLAYLGYWSNQACLV